MKPTPIAKYKALRFLDGGKRVFYYNKTKGYFIPFLIQIPNRADYELTEKEKETIITIQTGLGLDRNNFYYGYVDF